jgi:hypothetical protein
MPILACLALRDGRLVRRRRNAAARTAGVLRVRQVVDNFGLLLRSEASRRMRSQRQQHFSAPC